MFDKYTFKIFCKGCKRGMTWAEQKAQYARLKKRNYTDEQIKAIQPRCQKCVTRFLKDSAA